MVHLLFVVLMSLSPNANSDIATYAPEFQTQDTFQMAGLYGGARDEVDSEPSDCCVAAAPCCKRVQDSEGPEVKDSPDQPPTNVNDGSWWLANSTGAPGFPPHITADACTA